MPGAHQGTWGKINGIEHGFLGEQQLHVDELTMERN